MKPMTPRLVCLYVCLCLGSALPFFLGANEPQRSHRVEADSRNGSEEDPSTSNNCVGGCSAVKNTTDALSEEQINDLLATLANEAPTQTSQALETLLFHGLQVGAYIDEHGVGTLALTRERRLRAELAKTHVLVSVRITDSLGQVRMDLCERVPVGVKQHLHAATAVGISPPEVSFTVQRVGLHHLWTRI